MKQIRYFDHAATTAVDEQVLKSMLPYYNIEYGNPSAVYGLGRSARKAIDESREKIANIIGAKKNEIYFCSPHALLYLCSDLLYITYYW